MEDIGFNLVSEPITTFLDIPPLILALGIGVFQFLLGIE